MTPNFYVGPWHLNKEVFVAPPGCQSLVDLSPNHAVGSRGVFVGGVLGLDYEHIPEHRLKRFIWDSLTTNAAPDGLGKPFPLVPTTHGHVELFLGPLGLSHRERFSWEHHPHTNRLRDVLRSGFQSEWDRNPVVARKVLDFNCEKYKLRGDEWKHLVPPRLLPHVPGRLPHATTITDNFNRADSGSLGSSSEGWSWTDLSVSPTWGIINNGAYTTNTSASRFARAEIDLSSADHYVQLTRVDGGASSYQGPCARFETAAIAGAVNCYLVFNDDTSFYLQKFVIGVQGPISSTSRNRVAGDIYKVQANGSTIKGFVDGVELLSNTDTSVTGNLRTGMHCYSGANPNIDDFSAADLGGAFIDNTSSILRCILASGSPF